MVEARRGRGTYTDDTEMMIVLAESLLEHGCVEDESLATAFLERCDPSRGYGAGTLQVLALWRQGVPVDAAPRRLFDGEGSLGNGAAMRIAPVAVLFADAPQRLRAQAERSARLTHAHPLAIDAAVAQAAAIAAALRGEDILAAGRGAARQPELRSRLERAAVLLESEPGPAAVADLLGNSAIGHESVPTAMFAAASQGGFEEAVSFAVRCGGDTDTLGAMAGALAGRSRSASRRAAGGRAVGSRRLRGRSHDGGVIAPQVSGGERTSTRRRRAPSRCPRVRPLSRVRSARP
jgi:ADP-ribosylglycohydrolase